MEKDTWRIYPSTDLRFGNQPELYDVCGLSTLVFSRLCLGGKEWMAGSPSGLDMGLTETINIHFLSNLESFRCLSLRVPFLSCLEYATHLLSKELLRRRGFGWPSSAAHRVSFSSSLKRLGVLWSLDKRFGAWEPASLYDNQGIAKEHRRETSFGPAHFFTLPCPYLFPLTCVSCLFSSRCLVSIMMCCYGLNTPTA